MKCPGRRGAVDVSVPSGMGRAGLWQRAVQGNCAAVLRVGRERVCISLFPGHRVSLCGFNHWVQCPEGHGMLLCPSPLHCGGITRLLPGSSSSISCPRSGCLLVWPRNPSPQPQNHLDLNPPCFLLPRLLCSCLSSALELCLIQGQDFAGRGLLPG